MRRKTSFNEAVIRWYESDENDGFFDKKPVTNFKNLRIHLQIRVLHNILLPLGGQISYFSGIPNENMMATYKFKSLLYLLGFIFCAWLYYQTGNAELLPNKNEVVVAANTADSPQAEFTKL